MTPLLELLPIERRKAADELAVWHVEEAHIRRPELSKLWADHFASVADYWAHKRRHPDTRAGALVALYSWAGCVAVAASIVSFNPIAIAMVASGVRRLMPEWHGASTGRMQTRRYD